MIKTIMEINWIPTTRNTVADSRKENRINFCCFYRSMLISLELISFHFVRTFPKLEWVHKHNKIVNQTHRKCNVTFCLTLSLDFYHLNKNQWNQEILVFLFSVQFLNFSTICENFFFFDWHKRKIRKGEIFVIHFQKEVFK